MSFSAPYVSKRSSKSLFFKQINELVDWKAVERVLEDLAPKGNRPDGRPAHSRLVLFKMLLLGIWYGLSDRDVEDRVSDQLSWGLFAGLSLEDPVPDHSTLSRFRSELAARGGIERVLQMVNQTLENKGIIIKTGTIVDASLTDSPRRPKGAITYEIAEDRQENQPDGAKSMEEAAQIQVTPATQPGVDAEARWLKKGKKTYFGYKKHVLTDREGLILKVRTSAANVHDSKYLEALVEGLPKGTAVMADKGYASEMNDNLLKSNKLKNRIMKKGARNRALSAWEKRFNKLISKSRYKIERSFGSMKHWFGAGIARYVGLAKTHIQHELEAIAYNLYRSPNLFIRTLFQQKQTTGLVPINR